MDEVANFFCQFPNPWALRVSGMGGYTSKCEKKSKSLHPSVQSECTVQYSMSSFNKNSYYDEKFSYMGGGGS